MTKEQLKVYFDYSNIVSWIRVAAWVVILVVVFNFSPLIGGIALGIMVFLIGDNIESIHRRQVHEKSRKKSAEEAKNLADKMSDNTTFHHPV